jgi:hypothetical protein
MLIFFGSRSTLSGTAEVFMYECPFCEKNNSTSLFVYSRYYHVFWIPVFPYSKEAFALCSECKTKRSELKFGPKLVSEYRDCKKRFRHPWWTWSWTIIFISVILAIVIVAPK